LALSLAQVKILYARRDIKKGEEICFTYVGFDDVGERITPEMSREELQKRWGIVCDENCLCYDKKYIQKLNYGKELDTAIVGPGMNPSVSLARVNKLLELEKELNLLQVRMKRTLFDGFQIGIMRKKTMKLGLDYVNEAYELAKRIAHPEYNGLVKMYKMYMELPSAHTVYLLHDRFHKKC